MKKSIDRPTPDAPPGRHHGGVQRVHRCYCRAQTSPSFSEVRRALGTGSRKSLLFESSRRVRFTRWDKTFDWERRLQDYLHALGIITVRIGWEVNATRTKEWYHRFEEGATWFMDEGYEREGPTKEYRRLDRERKAAGGQATTARESGRRG